MGRTHVTADRESSNTPLYAALRLRSEVPSITSRAAALMARSPLSPGSVVATHSACAGTSLLFVEFLASGRAADLFARGPGTVLRRYRDGRSASAEAEVVGRLHVLGFPVPAVRAAAGPDLVLERVEGVTMAEKLFAGDLSLETGGVLLATLPDRPHALPRPGGRPLLHLDPHPGNVLMGPDGPVVID